MQANKATVLTDDGNGLYPTLRIEVSLVRRQEHELRRGVDKQVFRPAREANIFRTHTGKVLVDSI